MVSDRFKIKEETETGVFRPRTKYSETMDKYSSIFQPFCGLRDAYFKEV